MTGRLESAPIKAVIALVTIFMLLFTIAMVAKAFQIPSNSPFYSNYESLRWVTNFLFSLLG